MIYVFHNYFTQPRHCQELITLLSKDNNARQGFVNIITYYS